MSAQFYIAAAAELAIAAAMFAGLIYGAVAMVRDIIRDRARNRRAAVALSSSEYCEACEAASAAWDAVNASRNADGYATCAAMDAYRAAARQRDSLQRAAWR